MDNGIDIQCTQRNENRKLTPLIQTQTMELRKLTKK